MKYIKTYENYSDKPFKEKCKLEKEMHFFDDVKKYNL